MENLNILLLGAGNRVSLCERLSAAAETYGCKANLYSIELSDEVPIRKYATIIIGTKWTDLEFEPLLMHTISHYGIDIILPLMDGATVALSKLKHKIDLFCKPTWAVVSDPFLCEIFNDKGLSEQWFNYNKVAVPNSGLDYLYPKIVKRKDGYGSRGQFTVNNREEFDILTRNLKVSDYIIQQVISGPEYTIDAYVSREGNVCGAVSRQRLIVVNGEVNKGVTKREEDLLLEVRRILSVQGFEGPITLQAIRSEISRQWYFIEINPRFGGGVIQSIEAGANFAEALIADYLHGPLPDLDNWKEGLIMMRANQEIWI